MKIIKKITVLIMCFVLCLSAFACGKKKDDSQGGNDSTQAKEDRVIHTVKETLHNVNVTESNISFVVNSKTQYKIYVDLSDAKYSASMMKSATFVRDQVLNATGAEMEILTELPANFTSKTNAIVYGFKSAYAALGMKVPSENIGSTGYYIKSNDNAVFIEANGNDGYRMGGLAFLREVLGYDMITEDCIVYSRNASTMPKMDIVEKPDFDYRQIQNYTTSIEAYGTGMYTHSDIWIPINGWDMHNTLYYIPVSEYGESHPDWYREDRQQACYTAHGNLTEYNALLQTVFEVMKKRMQECPTLENISFTAMDGTGQDSCTCDTCLEYKNLYGSPAATCIYFMNDLNKLVQAYIDEYEPGRVMNLVFFAYHDAEPAPVEREKQTYGTSTIWGDPVVDENGNYIPLKRYKRDENGAFAKDENGDYVYETDENGNYVYLTCDEHVYPWLAPIYAKFTSSFYDEVNKSYAQNVALWYTISENVYVWIYETNFSYYMYPYNTWSVVPETLRYLYDCGVKYVWIQAQERNQSTAFADLKDYIDAKFEFDVNADYAEVIDNYFNNYYLEASDEMRRLFDLIQGQSKYIEETVSTVSGGIYDSIGNAEYWPRSLLEEMVGIINEAYAKIEKYKNTDPTLYANLVKRIKKESIFPRYALCVHFGDYYSNIDEMRTEFKNDWNELGFTIYKESDGEMQSVFDGWGI